MQEKRSLTIVTISTILFGIISKWLVGIPYMMWGHFDLHFILSLVLWVLYSTSLYVSWKMDSRSNESMVKIGLYGLGLKQGLSPYLPHRSLLPTDGNALYPSEVPQ